MNYSSGPSNSNSTSATRRRPTDDKHQSDPYSDDYRLPHPVALPGQSSVPRRKPVGRTSTIGYPSSRLPQKDVPSRGPAGGRHSTAPINYDFPYDAELASGYNQPKSGLVYPDEFIYIHPEPRPSPPPPPLPPPPPPQQQQQHQKPLPPYPKELFSDEGGYFSNEGDLYDHKYDDIPQAVYDRCLYRVNRMVNF